MTKTAKRAKWVMPSWMAPYREVLEESAYGLGVEDLMNDHGSDFFNNAYRAAVIVGLKEAIHTLMRLRNAGLLRATPSENTYTGEEQ